MSPSASALTRPGHCNGWRGHSGARPWLAELLFAPDNVVDTAAQFDNFARNAVGKTVAQVANTLAKSDWTSGQIRPGRQRHRLGVR